MTKHIIILNVMGLLILTAHAAENTSIDKSALLHKSSQPTQENPLIPTAASPSNIPSMSILEQPIPKNGASETPTSSSQPEAVQMKSLPPLELPIQPISIDPIQQPMINTLSPEALSECAHLAYDISSLKQKITTTNDQLKDIQNTLYEFKLKLNKNKSISSVAQLTAYNKLVAQHNTLAQTFNKKNENNNTLVQQSKNKAAQFNQSCKNRLVNPTMINELEEPLQSSLRNVLSTTNP